MLDAFVVVAKLVLFNVSIEVPDKSGRSVAVAAL